MSAAGLLRSIKAYNAYQGGEDIEQDTGHRFTLPWRSLHKAYEFDIVVPREAAVKDILG